MTGTANGKDASLSLAIEGAAGSGPRPLGRAGEPGLKVVLTNEGSSAVRIWEDDNSWGYDALRFEISADGARTSTLRKKERDWRKNTPTFWTLEPGGRHVYDVSFGGDDWESLPKQLSGKTATLRAVLSFEADAKSKELGVWTGTVRSPPGEYRLR